MATAQYIEIIFTLSEVQVLSRAVRESQEDHAPDAAGPEAPEFSWLDVAAPGDDVQVIDVYGDRLFVIRHSLADWGLVCAYLTRFAWSRTLGADRETPEGEHDLNEADFAWFITARISEAIL